MSSLKEHKAHPLSDAEVVHLVKGKAKVVTYDQLHRYKTIDELLSPHGAVFLLYQQKPNYGHWVALFKRENNRGNVEIEHFDAYGVFPDDELFWTSKEERKKLKMDFPYLTKLLYEAPRNYDIIYNEFPFQKKGNGINTCGRHAVMRLQHKDKSLNEYVSHFKKLMGGKPINSGRTDDVVTEETYFALK